ncbi:hypothetical protein KAZ92_01380 [Candidatus Gracilibacteria bacterium]|nr:hypothetical protein [Candidatus Gracilibacteria bacterium]
MENITPNNDQRKQEFIDTMKEELMEQQSAEIETITQVLKSQPLQKFYLGDDKVFDSEEEAMEYVEKLGLVNELASLQDSSSRRQKDLLQRKKLTAAVLLGNMNRENEIRAMLPQIEKIRPMATVSPEFTKKLDEMDVKNAKSEESDEQDQEQQIVEMEKQRAEESNRQRLMAEQKKRQQEDSYQVSRRKSKKKGWSLAAKVFGGAAVVGTGAAVGTATFPLLFKGLV